MTKKDFFLTLKTLPPINHLTERKHSCHLYKKSSRITFQPTYANLLSSNITQHDEFTKENRTKKPFPAKNVLKQTTYKFAIRGKNPSYFIVCVKTRNPIISKLITIRNKINFRIKPFSEEPFLECGRRGGLMVSALDSGPGRGCCVVGKTLYSHGASLHPGV